MIIRPCPTGLEGLLGLSTGPRGTGLHVSDIYNDLYARLEPDRYGGKGGPDPLRLEAGLGFESELEAMLEAGIKRRLVRQLGRRPGELVSDEGILMSPDLILFNGDLRVGEIKLTWMSCAEMPMEEATAFPVKFRKWQCQIMSYCRLIGTNKARLIGFFVNGDYRPPTPKLLAWDIEFTDQEIRDNWTMLINHAKHMGVLS